MHEPNADKNGYKDLPRPVSLTIRTAVVALPLTAWGLHRLLEDSDHGIEVAAVFSDTDAAIAQAGAQEPDVLLLDLDSLQTNAKDLSDLASLCESAVAGLHRALRARILVVGSCPESLIHDRAVLAGARGVLSKTESPTTLAKAVQKVHEGEMWIDRTATGRIFLELARQKASGMINAESDRVTQLTSREWQTVLAVVGDPSTPGKVLAKQLHISEHTLRNHLTSIYSKLGVSNRAGLYAFAVRNHLLKNPVVAPGN